ncbi:MAG: hypothetical protein M3357_04415 [Actinomycetota bacterium]|nr:hypothetical protein [Actinomycetota bacterium]
MADTSQQLLEAMEAFNDVADAVTPEAALEELDETTLQMFWRDWPHIASWAGSLWRRLNQELAEPATPADEAEVDTGGSG